MNQTRKICVLA